MVGSNEIVTRLNTSWSLSSSWSFTTSWVGWVGVLDEIKAISAPAKLELGLGLSLATFIYDLFYL